MKLSFIGLRFNQSVHTLGMYAIRKNPTIDNI